MMRKRKALSSVNGNILSRPPVRRLDSYVSVASLEDEGQADSKTPKISNIGGLSTNEAPFRRSPYRRPPLPTRPKEGKLGSSILDPARRTPRRARATLSFGWSPKRASPAHFGPGVNHIMIPKLQRTPFISHQATREQPQVAGWVKPSFEKRSIEKLDADAQGFDTRHLQVQHGIPAIDRRRNNSTRKSASRTVTFVAAKQLESHSAVSEERVDALQDVNETDGLAWDKKENDDDMNCDSSGEASLLNLSDSSPEGQIGSMGSIKIRPTHQTTSKNQRLSPGKVQNATGKSAVPFTADRQTNQVGDELEKDGFSDRMTQGATAMKRDSKETRLVGSTVGANRFERENLAEDTDITDMASLPSDDEHTSDALSDDKDDVDENHNENPMEHEQVTSRLEDRHSEDSKHSSESSVGEMEDNTDKQRTARRLTFDDSLEGDSRKIKAKDFKEVESIEAWSIDGHTNSPVLIQIDGKKYIHPPLPAGWRIRISKTHKRPIYIHPDIGRTFHCPVDLPRNVVYVRRRDGKLEKRTKVDLVVDTDSPRTQMAPDTPPSVTQQSPASCFRSPSSDNLGSVSGSDSTSQLIRSAMRFSAFCVRSSSQNLRRAEILIGNAKSTPSTLSDVVRGYETEMSKDRESVEYEHPREKDGYDCDISDSGGSRESSSSVSIIQKTDNVESNCNYDPKSSNTGALPSDLVTPMTAECLQFHEHAGGLSNESEVETQTSKLSESFQAKKHLRASSIDETLETWLTPGPPSDKCSDIENYSEPTTSNSHKPITQRKESLAQASVQNLVQGEYIDGWFTPNAIIEEVATLRHSAKRHQSSDITQKSSPKSFKRGWILYETTESQLPPRSGSNYCRSHDLGILNTPHPNPKEIDQPSKKQQEHQKSGETKTTSNGLLPFFDIFEKHLAVDTYKDSTDAKTAESDNCFTSGIQDIGIDVKDHLPDWKSPNCSEIAVSSPTENDISRSSVLVGTASSPFNRHIQNSESGSSAHETVDATVAFSRRALKKGLDRGDDLTKPVSTQQCGREDKDLPRTTPSNVHEETENEVSASATVPPDNEKQRILNQTFLPPSKTGDSHLKHDSALDAPSDIEFLATDYESPEISTERFPGPESESAIKENDTSDPSPSIDAVCRESPISQNDPHHDDGNNLEGDSSLKQNGTSRSDMNNRIHRGNNLTKSAPTALCEREDRELAHTTLADAQEKIDNEVSSPTTLLPYNEKQKTVKQTLLLPSKIGKARLKHDPALDDAPSEVEFQATDYQSPDNSTEGFPGPESETFINDDSQDTSDSSPSIEVVRKEQSLVSQNDPHHDDDNSLEGDISLGKKKDKMDWSGSAYDGASSPTIVSTKIRRMSWRVLNPTYPRCSLQRLEEIALHQTKMQKNKKIEKKRPSTAIKKKRKVPEKGVQRKKDAKHKK